MVLLTLGFALGQGSIFVAQTWLVIQQQLEFLGLFGVHFTFAVLAYGVVDMGALTTVPKKVAADQFDGNISGAYWPVVVARLPVAVIVCVAFLAYGLGYGGVFSASYAIGIAPGLVIWSFNAGGLLDGLRRSGLSGLLGSLPYVASASVLPIALTLALDQAGLVLGLSFSIGLALAVILMILLLKVEGSGIRWERPHNSAVRAALLGGGAVLANWLPGQLFYRLQIVLCGVFLGPLAMGAFVYGKQIINAAGQFIALLRRVEFPILVSRLSKVRSHLLRETISTLWVGLALALLGTVTLLGIALWARTLLPEHAPVASAIAVLSPLIVTGALYLTLTQGLLASGRFGAAARVSNAMVVIGLAATVASAPQLALAGFVFAEATMHLVGTGLILSILMRTQA